jgi:hypothetical protein
MDFLNDPKILTGVAVLIFCIVLYFYINYQISLTLKHELHRMKKQKQLKINKQQELMYRQQMKSRSGKHDQDSYFDPDDVDMEGDDYEDFLDKKGDDARLTKDNIGMRDMMM